MSERTASSSAPAAKRPVRVWDLPTRLFHWALVVLVGFSWWSGEQGGDWLKWHFWSGYSILTLLLFRLAWGFVGSATARFSGFLRGPTAGVAHLRELLGRHEPRDVGHNPVGGWMVVVLIVLLLVQAGSGLFAEDRNLNGGPLSLSVSTSVSNILTDVHEMTVNVLLVTIGLHVTAAVGYLVFKRDNLIAAMFTGKKQLDLASGNEPKMVSPWLALGILILCGLLLFGFIALVRATTL